MRVSPTGCTHGGAKNCTARAYQTDQNPAQNRGPLFAQETSICTSLSYGKREASLAALELEEESVMDGEKSGASIAQA